MGSRATVEKAVEVSPASPAQPMLEAEGAASPVLLIPEVDGVASPAQSMLETEGLALPI